MNEKIASINSVLVHFYTYNYGFKIFYKIGPNLKKNSYGRDMSPEVSDWVATMASAGLNLKIAITIQIRTHFA